MEQLIQWSVGYGFAGLFAVLFWRYIRDVQMKQVEKLHALKSQLDRIEEAQYRRERDRQERADQERAS